MRRVQRTYLAALFLVCVAAMVFAGCGGGGSTIVIEIQPSGSQTVDEGGVINFNAIVGGDTTGKGVNWTTKPAGLTGTNCGGSPAAGCGTLSNATPSSVTYTAPTGISAGITATETVVSNADASATQTISISVVLAPTFSSPCVQTVATCPLQGGANGVQYNQAIAITGGVAPYTYSVVSGSLPACLTLNGLANSTTNTIVGTPCGTVLKTSTFTIQVKDNANGQASEQTTISQTFSITIQPPPPLSIVTNPLPQGFTNTKYTGSLTANGGVLPLTWGLQGGGNTVAPGLTLNPTTGQITGIPTSTGTFSFQVNVKDSSLPNPPAQTAGPQSMSITIKTPPALSITTASLPTGTVAEPTGYTASLQATGGIAPYTWSLIQGQLPSGLTLTTQNNSTGTISGIPVVAGTSTFTVEVTDSEVVPVTKTVTFSITINPGTTGGNSLFNGVYTFLFQGFDTGGPVAIVGTLTSDGNGHITAGSEDSNRYSAASKAIQIISLTVVPYSSAPPAAPTGSSYSVGTDGRGTLELEVVNGQGTTLTTDYQFVLDSSGNIHFFENNATGTNTDTFGTHGEGVMKPAAGAATATFSGNYAFLLSGVDGNNKREALGGVLNSDGTYITPGGSGPNTDFNDAGTFSSQNMSGTVGSGGASFVLEPAGKAQTTLNFIFFFVSSSDLYFIEDDLSSATFPNPPRLSGEMILQNPTTIFNQAVLGGTSVTTGTGVDGSNASVFGGLLTSTLCDGNASVSLAADENDAGTVTTAESFSGTCTVAANGHATFTLAGVGNPAPTPRIAGAYLTGPGSGFLLGSDAAVTTGMLEQQSGRPYADSSVVGGYTLAAPFPGETNAPNVVGQVSADGAGDITGTVDAVVSPGKPAYLGQSLSATINGLTAAGRSPVTTNAPTGLPTNLILYLVSPSSARAISADSGDANPQVFFFDH